MCKGTFSTGDEDTLDFQRHYMFIMREFGTTLEDHQNMSETQNNCLGLSFGVQVAIQLLELLQTVHEAGYVYNDLKTQNLMMGMADTNSCSNLKLIDFGLSSSYLDSNGKHISQKKESHFKGN